MRSEPKMRRRAPRVGSGRFKIKHALIASQQADLLQLVRAHEGLSRIELARSLKLAPSTVGIYVDHLVAEGYLFEGRKLERDYGRPPTILALNPRGGRFIGVDFEARNIMAVAVDFSQSPLKRIHQTIAASDSVRQILTKIENAIAAAMAGDGREVLGIGVGVPGVIDSLNGVALHYKHIKGWSNVPLVARLARKFGVPVFLENNMRTMALAEFWFGQGRGARNFICIGVRSGIGAGIIIDGQIYHGADNRAGEIRDWPCMSPLASHTNGTSESKPFATLEEIASFQSVRDRLARSGQFAAGSPRAPGTDVPVDALVRAAREGDKLVLDILERVARALGLVLSQLSLAFDPEKIILAGVFTAFGDLFLQRLEENLARFAPPAGRPRVVNSALGDFNGALGAAALAVHQWKPATR
jgi:N-acetylglucosamine repressor